MITKLLRPGFYGPAVVALTGLHLKRYEKIKLNVIKR